MDHETDRLLVDAPLRGPGDLPSPLHTQGTAPARGGLRDTRRIAFLLDTRPALAAKPFYLLPATSGVKVHGADGIRETYFPYESSTVRAGVRVPILYMRTTKGRDADRTLDPEADTDRRCGDRRIAEDSLASVIAHAVANRLPVHFTLNRGIWADASCDVPDSDINDELERDAGNCQWTARMTRTPAGHSIPLRWPHARVAVDPLQIDVSRKDSGTPIRIVHVAVYPRERALSH